MRNCVTPKAESLSAPGSDPFVWDDPTGPLIDAAVPKDALAEFWTPTATWAALGHLVFREISGLLNVLFAAGFGLLVNAQNIEDG